MTRFGRLAKSFDFLADRKPSMMLTLYRQLYVVAYSNSANKDGP
jgi:hypothetical protein